MSLAKLSALAADENEASDDLINTVEHHLSVITAQEQLPKSVREAFNFDKETMRVLTPRELIEVTTKINLKNGFY